MAPEWNAYSYRHGWVDALAKVEHLLRDETKTDRQALKSVFAFLDEELSGYDATH